MSNLSEIDESLLNRVRSSPETFDERLESGITIEYYPYDYVISFHVPWKISDKNFSLWRAQFYKLSTEFTDVDPDEMCKQIMSQISEIEGVTDITASYNELSVSKNRLYSWGCKDDRESILFKIIKILENSRPNRG
ncbi:MAG: hypothetical protein ACOX6Q_01810 [Candidatus Dojkabacteria bacterium]